MDHFPLLRREDSPHVWDDLSKVTCKGAGTQTQVVCDSNATHTAFPVIAFLWVAESPLQPSHSFNSHTSFNAPSSGHLPYFSDQTPRLLVLCGSTCSKLFPHPKLYGPNLLLHKAGAQPKYGEGASVLYGPLRSSQMGLLALREY